MTDLTAKIIKAADEGKITLSALDDGADFQSVAEYLEYCSERAIQDIAIRFSLIADEAGDIHEMNRAADRERARFADIRGA